MMWQQSQDSAMLEIIKTHCEIVAGTIIIRQRIERILSMTLLLLSLTLLLTAGVIAQSGGGHTLFGDFKVDESKVSGLKPQRFDLILYAVRGSVVARQSITKNGRYRFEDLRNGDYVIVVQMETEEIARIRVTLSGAVSTDFRQDISLQWSPNPAGNKKEKAGVVSVANHYPRTTANDTLFLKAEEAVKKRRYDQAISLLEQIVNADPKDFEAWTELGTVYFIQKNNDAAEKAYLRAVDEQPSFGLALLNLGKLRLAQRNFNGAIEVLSRAVNTPPPSADANYFLGEAYLNEIFTEIRKGSQAIERMNESARKAVEYMNEAIRLDPTGKAEVHLRLADIYNVLKLKDQAVAECEKFLTKRPDYPDRKKLEQFITENKKP